MCCDEMDDDLMVCEMCCDEMDDLMVCADWRRESRVQGRHRGAHE